MAYKHGNPQNRMRAAALLRQLKGQLVDVTGSTVEAVSNTAASSEAYWQLKKASGVHVYQQDGGWHADLEFKGLPEGIPTVIGTPVPSSSRAGAIESVVGLMSICAQRDNVQPPAQETTLRWFRFDEHEVPIHQKLVADYAEQQKTLQVDPADIIHELEVLRTEIAGNGPVTSRAWDAADFDTRYDAVKFCHVAMALGVRQLTFDPSAANEHDMRQPAPGLH